MGNRRVNFLLIRWVGFWLRKTVSIWAEKAMGVTGFETTRAESFGVTSDWVWGDIALE